MMATPLLFVLAPWLAAPAVYSLRERGWRAAETSLAVAVALALAALAAALPLQAPPWLVDSYSILGRELVMTPADRPALTQTFLLAALIFGGAGLRTQGRYFLAAGVGILGLLAAALLVRPFLYSAIFIQLAAGVAMLMVADEAHRASTGALRFLVYTTLGVPLILFTGWLVETGAANPETPGYLTQAAVCLAAGFSIWLAVVPFHSWLPVMADEAPPLATAFVTAVMRTPVIFLLLALLDDYAWLAANPLFSGGMLLAGGAMVALGALFVFGQQNLGRSVGYALLIEFGAVLLGVGLGSRAGVQAVLAGLSMRGIGLWLWAVGLDQLRRAARARAPEDEGGDDTFAALGGLGWRHPFATAAVTAGLLSLVGLPLMAGFPPRWALLRLLAENNPLLAGVLLVAMASVGLVVMRGLAALATPPTPDQAIQPTESRPARVVFSLGILAVIALGAFPQWVLPAVTDVSAFTRFGR